MSEYQYHEFCKLQAPLSAEARKEMHSLSSRAKVSTHNASYVYNYGDFCGDPKKLLLKYFDVYFYISNWGSIQLIFKYSVDEIDIDILKKYCVKHLISCEQRKKFILLDIDFNNEDGFGWIEGEGILSELLPLYEEIKLGDYRFLQLIAAINNMLYNYEHSDEEPVSDFVTTPAQQAFIRQADIEHVLLNE